MAFVTSDGKSSSINHLEIYETLFPNFVASSETLPHRLSKTYFLNAFFVHDQRPSKYLKMALDIRSSKRQFDI